MNLYPVFTRKLVSELEKQGFKVIQIAPNRNNPNLNVYYFEETVELRRAVQELVAQQ